MNNIGNQVKVIVDRLNGTVGRASSDHIGWYLWHVLEVTLWDPLIDHLHTGISTILRGDGPWIT